MKSMKRFGNFIKNLSFEKPYLKRWGYQMLLHGAFALQGILGILTFSLFTKNLTATPSGKLALQQSICNDYTAYKKAKQKADETGEECEVADPTDPLAMDEEMDSFIDRMMNGNEKNVSTGKGSIRVR